MNTSKTFIISVCIFGLFANISAAKAEQGSTYHSAQASKHSAFAGGHLSANTGKVASGVVAAPILLSGAVTVASGSVLLSTGESIASSGAKMSAEHKQHHGLCREHNREHNRKHNRIHNNCLLPITDIVITADPAPNKVTQVETTTTHETTVVEKSKSTHVTR